MLKKPGLLLPVFICTLFLFSCLKDDNVDDQTGRPDPVEWKYGITWKETEEKIGDGEWTNIPYGNSLELSFNYVDSVKTILQGMYGYVPSRLYENFDRLGFVLVTKDSMSFSYPLLVDSNKDTLTLPIYYINNPEDTFLVIRNIKKNPVIEVKYKKSKFVVNY